MFVSEERRAGVSWKTKNNAAFVALIHSGQKLDTYFVLTAALHGELG